MSRQYSGQCLHSSKPSDADAEESLMASALLEIRSDARREVINGAATTLAPPPSDDAPKATTLSSYQPEPSTPPKKRRVPPKKIRPNTTHNNHLIAPNITFPHYSSSNPYLAQSTLSYNQNNVGVFSPEQLAALQVAAAASAATFAATAGAASHPLAHSNFLHSAALSGAHFPAIQHQTQHQQPQTASIPKVTSTQSFSRVPSFQSECCESAGSSVTTECIRREQVEAALKSKPQRGRKREDLNELERLELTRTRNREHAKSTRIRKKARHQELLDIEKKFDDLLSTNILLFKRRTAVSELFKNRELMLHNFQPSDSSHSSGENTAPVGNKTCSLPSLEELVENMAQFQYADGLDHGIHTEKVQLSGAEQMRRFDDYVYSGVVAKFSDPTLMRVLRYQIRGNENGIALDSSDGGMAEVDLVLDLPTKVTLMTGVWRFRFGLESEKIQSVSSIQILNLLASSIPSRLWGQTSYPSTVSLDPIVQQCDSFSKGGESKQDQDLAGPGMSI
ncbi:hypothetical protein ACA910_008083 [Epithemia clementina (nom. ined.)]